MMYDLTGFQRDLLYVVAGLDGSKGLAVQAALNDYYDAEVLHSRLYRNLERLVEMGLVETGNYDGRTNSYTITRRGENELKDRRVWENQYID